MVMKIALLVVLLPIVLSYPDGMEGMDENKLMTMMKMFMMKKQSGHYPGDADGCKKPEEEDDKMKMWMKKMKEEEEMKKVMKDMYEFKMFMAKKKEMEEKHAKEQEKKMMEMYQKHKEMKMKEEKEKQLHEMISSFQETKHKYAFKLVHEMLSLCRCGEVSMQMEKMMGAGGMNKMNMTDGMDDDDATRAMDAGDMAMLAQKLSKMTVEQKQKFFMAGMIKSMCEGSKMFIAKAKQFEVEYMSKTTHANTDAPETTTSDPFVSS